MSCNPAIRYAGGKRKLIPEILKYIPTSTQLIVEPFCGSAALSFSQDKGFILNDTSEELINFYEVLQFRTDELVDNLKKLDSAAKDKDLFLKFREMDRVRNFTGKVCMMDRAVRYYYIIRAGFNGLYRVNGSGYCNTPFGDRCYATDEQVLREAAKHLNTYCEGYSYHQFDDEYNIENILECKPSETFIFIDPPYQDGDDGKHVYQEYTTDKINEEFYQRLDKYLDKLDSEGYKFLMTNTYCKFITDRFSRFNIDKIPTKYSIAADGESRGVKFEAFVHN